MKLQNAWTPFIGWNWCLLMIMSKNMFILINIETQLPNLLYQPPLSHLRKWGRNSELLLYPWHFSPNNFPFINSFICVERLRDFFLIWEIYASFAKKAAVSSQLILSLILLWWQSFAFPHYAFVCGIKFPRDEFCNSKR